jgi:ATP-dependent Clp protease ATP-binding subunit ClpC
MMLEHVLLALSLEGQGVAARVLVARGATIPEVRRVVDERIGPSQKSDVRPIRGMGLMPELKKALLAAHEESWKLNHNYVGTEHLLLGLACTEGGAALLRALGMEPETVCREVIAVLEKV